MSIEEAIAHLRAGRPQAATTLLTSRLERDPHEAQSWFLLGACHDALGDLEAAADAFSHAVTLDPQNVQACLGLIAVLRSSGKKQLALGACKEALSRGDDPRLLYAAALCCEELDEYQEALGYYTQAIRASPEQEVAKYNKALLLSRLGRQNEAEELLAQLNANQPGVRRYLEAYADVLLAQDRYADAILVLERAPPEHVAASVRRGVALGALRQFEESNRVFAEAIARNEGGVREYLQRIAPGARVEQMLTPEYIFLERSWSALGRCDWTSWDDFVSELRGIAQKPDIAVEPLVAFMSRLAPLGPSERHAVALRVAAAIELEFPALEPVPTIEHARVRIGVLSPDFREHLNAYLLLPLFELIDRTRFEIHAYSLLPDDGSAIGKHVRSAADSFQELHQLTERQMAQRLRDDAIDILLDVAGHTTGGRFAATALRPARIQVNYLGFSCSLASSRVDYAIVDRIVGSDDAEWTEARAFLPHTHFLYDFRASAALANVSRSEYGLPEDTFVYCAFHRAEKISPDVFALWMRILAEVPRSVLWFRALSERAASNLRAAAKRSGVDPSRLAFAPFEASHDPRYLARHRLGDLMLDSLHHNAMTSACDALGMGLPLLTLRGYAMAARAGESLVRAAGLPELVARDQEDYVRIAVQLAREPARLQALKDRLRANRHTAPLFDTAGRVRALEAAFQRMYDRMMRGEPPASFDV